MSEVPATKRELDEPSGELDGKISELRNAIRHATSNVINIMTEQIQILVAKLRADIAGAPTEVDLREPLGCSCPEFVRIPDVSGRIPDALDPGTQDRCVAAWPRSCCVGMNVTIMPPRAASRSHHSIPRSPPILDRGPSGAAIRLIAICLPGFRALA